MRKSGLERTGDLSWGTHFCLVYENDEELRGILIPFLRAGLENNEYCLWVVPGRDEVTVTGDVLAGTAPDLTRYLESGQLQILPWEQCDSSAETMIMHLDRALASGQDGLRIVAQAGMPRRLDEPLECYGNDQLPELNAIVACAYLRAGFDALGLMEAVKRHGFALLEGAAGWEVIESSEARSAKDALRRSEEKLQTVFGGMSEGFAYHRIVLDEAGHPCDYVFLEVNKAFEEQMGLKAAGLIGRKVTEVLPGIEDDPAGWIGRYGRVALTGEPELFESYAEPLEKWFAISAFSPHKGFFAATFSDITRRKKAELELMEREEELASIYENAPIIMLLVDEERHVRKANRSTEDFTGESFESLSGRRAGEALGCLNASNDEGGCGFGEECQVCPVRLAIADTFTTGVGVHQVEASRPFMIAGEPRDVTFLLSTARVNLRGEPRVLITIQDISARKIVEEQLRQTSDYLESLFSFANAPIMTWDSGLRITRFNKAFERLTGYTADEVVGNELRMLFPDESREESLAKIATTLSGEYRESVEIPIRRKDGDTRVVLWNSANVFGPGGKELQATIAQGQDITMRKQAEEALKRSEQLARTLLDATEEPAMLMQADGSVLGTNEAATAIMTGSYSPQDVVSRQITELLPQDMVERFSEELDRMFELGRAVSYQGMVNGAAGEISLYPLFSTSGKITSVAVYARGINKDSA